MATTMTVRMDEEEKSLIQTYAEVYGRSASDFIRETVLERIEDEMDVRAWDQAYDEYLKNPRTYTTDEIMKILSA